jgi:molybdate transport system substrate-binding protein
VIVPRGAPPRVGAPGDLAKPDVRFVAMGDPDAVPAGVYGRRWLESMRLWTEVQPKVVPLPSSPAVVAAVREGRAHAGIVYVTDPTAEVTIVHRVAPADAPPIRYPAAAIARGRVVDARTFLAFLQSDEATRLIEAAGYRRPPL